MRPEMTANALALKKLREQVEELKLRWASGSPFRYLVMDDFLPVEYAEEMLAAYPEPDEKGWDDTTYIHQRKKFTKRSDFPEPIERFFGFVADSELITVMSDITGIPALIPD